MRGPFCIWYKKSTQGAPKCGQSGLAPLYQLRVIHGTWEQGTGRALRESGVRSDSSDSEKMIETMGKMMEQMMDYHD